MQQARPRVASCSGVPHYRSARAPNRTKLKKGPFLSGSERAKGSVPCPCTHFRTRVQFFSQVKWLHVGTCGELESDYPSLRGSAVRKQEASLRLLSAERSRISEGFSYAKDLLLVQRR